MYGMKVPRRIRLHPSGDFARGDLGKGLEAEVAPLSLQEGATSLFVSRFF